MVLHLKEYHKATFVTTFFIFCFSLYLPVIAPYIKSLGVSDFKLGLIFALLPITLLIFSSTLGSLSDRIGKKKMIILGMISQILAVALYMWGPHIAVFYIARVLAGLGYAGVVFVGLARVQDSISKKHRGEKSGWALTLISLGQLVAPVAGGLLADYWFVKAPFLVASVVLLIMIWIIAWREDIVIHEKVYWSEFNFIEKLRKFLSIRKLRGVGIMGVAAHASLPLIRVFIPVYIVMSFGLPYRFVGYAIFALQATHLLQFLMGRVSDRLGAGKVMIAGAFGYGAAMAALAFTDSYWVFVGILFLAGIAGSFWNVSAWSFMSDIGAKHKEEGFVIGSYISFAKIGEITSLIFGGLLIGFFGIKFFMILIGVLIIVGGIVSASMVLDRRKSPHSSKK
jgi:MFS family permease